MCTPALTTRTMLVKQLKGTSSIITKLGGNAHHRNLSQHAPPRSPPSSTSDRLFPPHQPFSKSSNISRVAHQRRKNLSVLAIGCDRTTPLETCPGHVTIILHTTPLETVHIDHVLRYAMRCVYEGSHYNRATINNVGVNQGTQTSAHNAIQNCP